MGPFKDVLSPHQRDECFKDQGRDSSDVSFLDDTIVVPVLSLLADYRGI